MSGTLQDAVSNGEPWDGSVPYLLMLLESAGAELSARVLTSLATKAVEVGDEGTETAAEPVMPRDDVTIIDRELARLFAVRELFLAWIEEQRGSGKRESAGLPAQFLRAWGESTGRVIQLLRARRDLGSGVGADALLDAVYQELEGLLPDSRGEPCAQAPLDGGCSAGTTACPEEAP